MVVSVHSLISARTVHQVAVVPSALAIELRCKLDLKAFEFNRTHNFGSSEENRTPISALKGPHPCELLRALERGAGFESIGGLSYRENHHWIHNPDRPVHRLEGNEIRLPNRNARVLRGYTVLGRQVDVVETSRGCSYDCSFCSIIEMQGRNFNTYSLDRVLADIRDACDHGAHTIFLVDDNVT